MKMLYVYSDEIAVDDILWGLYTLGVELDVYPAKIKIMEYVEAEKILLQTYMLQKGVGAVITYNFSMTIALACQELQVNYISWIFDSPQIALYTDSAKSKYNFIFVFDQAQYMRMRREGLINLYHLPLAANVDRASALVISEEDEKKYSNDISFVGNLYQKNGYNEKVNEFTEGMKATIDGIIQRIALNWGKGYECFDVFNQALVDEIYDKLHLDIDKGQHIEKKYMLELYLLSRKISEIDRIGVLNALAVHHDVTLYTNSDASNLQNVNVKGKVSYYEEMPKIFYLSKINLNITARSIETGIPQRIYDIMGVGGFVISNYQEELAEVFEPDKEIVLFHNIDELIEKVDYYLAHDEERLKIAVNGYKKVRDHYNTTEAVKKMLDKVPIPKDTMDKIEEFPHEENPLISVVIPTYNREKVIKNAIESVLMQSYSNWELIISDDGSTDQTEMLVRNMMDKDDRIKYIRREENTGAGAARNRGAAVATGDYIAFLDSDAVWMNYKLERQLQVFREHSNERIGLVFHACILSKKDKTEKWLPFDDIPQNFDAANILAYLLDNPLADTSTMMIPTQVWNAVGGFDIQRKCLEDYEISLRIATQYQVCYFHEPLAVTYYSAGSVNQNWKEGIKTYFYMLKRYADQYKVYEKLKLKRIYLMWYYCQEMGCADFFKEQYLLYVKEAGEDLEQLGKRIQYVIKECTTFKKEWDIYGEK